MSDRQRPRRVNATEARVRFGELLQSLADGDVVIVKGGIAVARLSAIRHGWDADDVGPLHAGKEETEAMMNEISIRTGTAGAIAKAPEAGGIARMEAATRSGWAGMDTDATIANIYRWRTEGGSRTFSLDEDDAAESPAGDDGSTLPDRQRHLYWGPQTSPRAADADDSKYRP